MANDLDKPVHTDFRGEIHRHMMQGVKFNTIYTRKGGLRSGDVHPNTQFDIILSGEVQITLRQNSKDVLVVKKANEFIAIPPGIPHLFRSLTDSVMIEWWDGEFICEYYEPYRKLIREQFEDKKLQ